MGESTHRFSDRFDHVVAHGRASRYLRGQAFKGNFLPVTEHHTPCWPLISVFPAKCLTPNNANVKLKKRVLAAGACEA